jgi:pimeloyl-ACP methyl ester carboxylesterase
MKLALLLPGYLESPDYLHLKIIENRLKNLGYTTRRVDPCRLWETGEVNDYNISNYLKQVDEIIESQTEKLSEVVLIGHSLGGSIAILTGTKNSRATKVVCINPAVSPGNSDSKWNENGIRLSKKDLPNDPTKLREFIIPISFVEDRKKYSITQNLADLKQPLLVIIGSEDKTKDEVLESLKTVSNPHVVIVESMGHDFRQSEELCNRVSGEIEKFLTKD